MFQSCVSLCCPDQMVVNITIGHCVYREDYKLQPPVSDDVVPEQLVSVHGEPRCDKTTVYDDMSQVLVTRHGLHIGHHVVDIDQYCLEEIDTGHELKMVAKVCDTSDPDDRQLLYVLSSKLTPALLIISEVFLLFTFILHVIVPEFRKQMFGEFL